MTVVAAAPDSVLGRRDVLGSSTSGQLAWSKVCPAALDSPLALAGPEACSYMGMLKITLIAFNKLRNPNEDFSVNIISDCLQDGKNLKQLLTSLVIL